MIEDSAVLDISLDMVTSKMVREKLKKSEKKLEVLLGSKIYNYVLEHKIGEKVRVLCVCDVYELSLLYCGQAI